MFKISIYTLFEKTFKNFDKNPQYFAKITPKIWLREVNER
jgi:hypothetical protein